MGDERNNFFFPSSNTIQSHLDSNEHIFTIYIPYIEEKREIYEAFFQLLYLFTVHFSP